MTEPKYFVPIGFVRMSACRYAEFTRILVASIPLLKTSSPKTWCRISVCFEFERLTGLDASYSASTLSSNTLVQGTARSGKKETPHIHAKKTLFFHYVSHSNTLCFFRRRQRHTLLRPGVPTDSCTSTHHYASRNRSRIRRFFCEVSVGIHFHANNTTPLK